MTPHRRTQLLPAFALLFEMMAVFLVFTIGVMRNASPYPLTVLFSVGAPYCWYMLYGFYVTSVVLFVIGVWFAVRGWKVSAPASAFALVLAGIWCVLSFEFWLPGFL